jgi:hypothetical protein
MPWIIYTPEPFKSATATAESTEMKSYAEVYREAQQTADDLAKMLAKKMI